MFNAQHFWNCSKSTFFRFKIFGFCFPWPKSRQNRLNPASLSWSNNTVVGPELSAGWVIYSKRMESVAKYKFIISFFLLYRCHWTAYRVPECHPVELIPHVRCSNHMEEKHQAAQSKERQRFLSEFPQLTKLIYVLFKSSERRRTPFLTLALYFRRIGTHLFLKD